MNRKFLLIFFLVIGVVVSSFGIYQWSNDREVNITMTGDIAIVKGMESMVEEAPIIVQGTFEQLDSSINGARNPKDPSKPVTDSYSEVKIYQFKVDEVLKGSISQKTIKAGYSYSMELNELKSVKKVTVKHPLWVEPKIGHQYVLFLKGPDPYLGFYTSSFTPDKVEIKPDKTLQLVLPTKGHQKQQVKAEGKVVNVSMEGFPENFVDSITGKQLEDLKKVISNQP